ncbi:MAG: aldo/keto reductase [Synoicihabitans sp.]
MKYRRLGNTDLEVSILSYGASPLGGVFGNVSEDTGIRTVHTAIDHGINFIDVSPYYGDTKAETVLGKALADIQRDRYFLATKCGQYGQEQFDFSAARVTKSLDESCARLGVDYIDVFQCHDIEFGEPDQIIDETLPALVKLREAGRIGYIGITGLPLKVFSNILDRVESGVVDTVLSFCRYELNDSSLADMLPYLQAKQVGIINASPTGMGLLTARGVPGWHPATPLMIETAQKTVAFCEAEGVDIVKLAVQYCVANPDIATTLVGTSKPENIEANIRYADEPLDEAMLAKVLEILEPIHNHNFTRGLPGNRDEIIPTA